MKDLIIPCISFFILIHSIWASKLIELNEQLFEKTINENDSAVILFYEQGCPMCIKWEKDLNEAIERLTGESLVSEPDENGTTSKILQKVSFCKIDAYRFEKITVDFQIESVPSVKFIRKKYGIINELTQRLAGLSSIPQAVINFLSSSLIKEWKEINSLEILRQIFPGSSGNILLYYPGSRYNENNTSIINDAAVYYDTLKLYKIPQSNPNISLLEYFNFGTESEQLLLFKKFDEQYVNYFSTYSTINLQDLTKWLHDFSYPAVLDMTYERFLEIYRDSILSFFYLYKDEASINYDIYSVFHSHAKDMRGYAYFFKDKISSEFGEKFADMFSIDNKNFPVIFALQFNKTIDNFMKYKLEALNPKDSMPSFIQKVKENKHERYFKSEASALRNPFYEGTVHKLVGADLRLEVMSDKRCVILYCYKRHILPFIFKFITKMGKKFEFTGKARVGILDLELNELDDGDMHLETNKFYIIADNTFTEIKERMSVKYVIDYLEKLKFIDSTTPITRDPEDEIELTYPNPFETFENPLNYQNLSTTKLLEQKIQYLGSNKGDGPVEVITTESSAETMKTDL